MSYFLHIAGSTFDLPDAKAAVELSRQIEAVQKGNLGAKLVVPLKEQGAVHIFVSKWSTVAISGSDDDSDRDGAPQIF